jgi:hypothetical protein
VEKPDSLPGTWHATHRTETDETLNRTDPAKDWGLDYFKSDSILGALSDDALSFLLYKGRALELDSGEVLFDVDQRGDSFFIVLKGLINLHRPYNNVYALIHSYGFGTAVGYVSLIGLHDRTGRAQAAQPSVVLEVNSDLFGLLQVDYPQDFGILLSGSAPDFAPIRHESSRCQRLAAAWHRACRPPDSPLAPGYRYRHSDRDTAAPQSPAATKSSAGLVAPADNHPV